MTLVKTFEEFKNGNLSQVDEAKQTVSQQDPQAGEIARWKVVLKAGKDEDSRISDENATQDALDALTKYDPFISWWKTGQHRREGGSYGGTATFMNPNSTSIGFADIGSHRQAGTLLKEKATITFIFKQLFTDDDKNALMMFDIKRVKPLATATVKDSKNEVLIWNSEKMESMKLQPPQEVKDASGNPVKIDKVSATIVSALEAPAVTTDTTTAAPVVTTNTTTQAPAATSNVDVAPFAGLKKSNVVNTNVKVIQKLISDKGGEAATALGSPAVDGKFGGGTEKAISLVVYGNNTTAVPEITKEIATSIFTKLGATQDQVTKLTAELGKPAANTGGGNQQSGSGNNGARQLPGGL